MKEKKRVSVSKGVIKWILILDLVLKWWFLKEGRVVFNQGVSFGLWPGVWSESLVFLGLLGLSFWWSKTERVGERLIIIGGLSNLADRLIYGAVIDYMKIPYLNLWVNLGDISISVGVLLILYELYDSKYGNHLRR